jgi:hypothetical protein
LEPDPNYHGEVRSRNTPDFVPIPYGVFRDVSLSHAAKLVYRRLKLYSGKDGRCYPKHATLAQEVCLSERQLRTVLAELRLAGWIEWRRRRTSCVYTVHAERKKTSGQTGGKLPVSAEGIRRSGAAETRRQKRGMEDHHPKRGTEENAAGTAGRDIPPAKPNSKSPVADDDPPCQVFASPRDELQDIYIHKTGLQISPDVERRIWEAVELRGSTPDAFMGQLRPHVANPWKNPAGFLTNFARKIASVSTAPPEVKGPQPPEPPREGNGRCSVCHGAGYARYDEDAAAREYCTCTMGQELKRVDGRAANALPQTTSATGGSK